MPSKTKPVKSNALRPQVDAGLSGSERAQVEFGAYLKALRAAKGLSQADTFKKAEKLAPDDLPLIAPADFEAERDDIIKALGQTTLVRIEAGKIGHIRSSTLMALASIYGETYEDMLAAYVAAVFYRTTTDRLTANDAVQQAFKREGGARPFFISNATKQVSLREVADWERNLVDRSRDKDNVTLWIVAPNFIDHENKYVQEMVVDCLLMRGAHVTYFVDARDVGGGLKFTTFARSAANLLKSRRAQSEPAKVGTIACYGLTNEELAWLTASFVIANPDDYFRQVDRLDGFMIVSDNGAPSFALKLPDAEVKTLVRRITDRLEVRKEIAAPGKPNNERLIYIPNALKPYE